MQVPPGIHLPAPQLPLPIAEVPPPVHHGFSAQFDRRFGPDDWEGFHIRYGMCIAYTNARVFFLNFYLLN